jgi:ketosteroid isomerase-like protein
MRSRIITPAILFILGPLQGCVQPPTLDVQAEEEAIREMYAQRLEQIQGGAELESKVSAYMSVFAADAVLMPPNAPTVEGPEAIEAWAMNFFGSYVLNIHELRVEVLEIGPQLAVRRFRSVGEYIPVDGSEPFPYDQKYVDHLRKKPDGSWEIVLHMWSPNNDGPTIWH